VQEIKKLERPHLYVEYIIEGFDTTETGLEEFLFYPNAYWLDEKWPVFFLCSRTKTAIFL
jgi:hypothetical protein